MPQARRFTELEVEGTAAELPLLRQIEVQARALRREADAGSDANAGGDAASSKAEAA
jgi:hypothetical protein